MNFCVESIEPGALRPEDGVFRSRSLVVSADAGVVADQILKQARQEAQNLCQQAQEKADAVVVEAERRVFEKASVLLQELEAAQEMLVMRAKDLVIDLAEALFERLTLQMTSQERLDVNLKRILHEAPPKLIDPVLRVHPDDRPLLPELAWQIVDDPELPPGVCRLEAAGGEWRADFEGGTAALKAALRETAEGGVADTQA